MVENERFDDGKRGFGVSDALALSTAWQDFLSKVSAGALQLPEQSAPPLMLEFFKAKYPPDQFENALNSQLQAEGAEQFVIEAIRSGNLTLWIAPVDGAVAERPAGGLIEFGRESLISGCYRPYNDTMNLAYGYPLFVKRRDWAEFIAALEAAQQPAVTVEVRPVKTRRRPGPEPDPDWPNAISKVTRACIAAGYSKPLARGGTQAIVNMLLSEMANLNKHFSDDAARRHAKAVISQLPTISP